MSGNGEADGHDAHASQSPVYSLTENIFTKIHGASLILRAAGMLTMHGMEDGSGGDRRDLFEVINELVEVSIFRLTEAQDVTEQLIAIANAH